MVVVTGGVPEIVFSPFLGLSGAVDLREDANGRECDFYRKS